MPLGTYVLLPSEVFVETCVTNKYYAELDSNNVVLSVRAVNPADCLDENGAHSEEVGAQFLKNLFKLENQFVETWYYKQNRGRLAMVGGTYNAELDIFIDVQRGDALVLNAEYDWIPPTQAPQDGKTYEYDLTRNVWFELSSGEPMYVPGENGVIYDDDGNLLEVDPE